jgi:hypothetical protein
VGPAAAPVSFEERVGLLLRVASELGTGIGIGQLSELLPADGPRDESELADWLSRQPQLGKLSGNGLVVPYGVALSDAAGAGAARAEQYVSFARQLLTGPLRNAGALLHCAGVTGSAAYGTPTDGDDCDLFAVTRTGAVWPFLAMAFLRLRLRERLGPTRGDEPPICLNYVVDAAEAERDFALPKGFLFAREALSARVILGEASYAGMLARARWMGSEAPRLYARRTQGAVSEPEKKVWPVLPVMASALVYPVLAAYLQLKGLRANSQLRKRGRPDLQFATVTRWSRMMLRTRRFAELERVYSAPGGPARMSSTSEVAT